MKRVLMKELLQQIQSQIEQINRNNAQVYGTLKQLKHIQQQQQLQALYQKLDLQRLDVKATIRHLSSNVDTIYQIIDAKLTRITQAINQIMHNSNNSNNNNSNNNNNNNNNNSINKNRTLQKIGELEQKLLQIQKQKQSVCQQNVLLNDKIKQMNVRLTNNSNNNNTNNTKTNPKQTPEQKQVKSKRSMRNSSADKYKPASKTLIRLSSQNDLTFNNQSFRSSRSLQKHQQSKHSLSSMLIQQQNSFQSSYGLETIKNHKFSFGCLPFRSSGSQDLLKAHEKHSMNGKNKSQKENDENNENHRWRFLLTNLKESQQQGSILKSQSSRYSYEKLKDANQNNISKQSIKVYQI